MARCESCSKDMEWLTVEDIVEALDLSTATVYRTIWAGHLKAYKKPGEETRRQIIRVRRRDLDSFMEEVAARPEWTTYFPGRTKGWESKLEKARGERRKRAKKRMDAHHSYRRARKAT